VRSMVVGPAVPGVVTAVPVFVSRLPALRHETPP
jgi:hypothetical protein